jgi:hypothetical protein
MESIESRVSSKCYLTRVLGQELRSRSKTQEEELGRGRALGLHWAAAVRPRVSSQLGTKSRHTTVPTESKKS